MGRFIEIDGIKIDIIRKKGKKNLSLKINTKTGLPELTIPWLCPLIFAKSFAQKNIVWLKAHLKTIPAKQKFENGMQICVLGKELTIFHSDKKTLTHIQGNLLVVSGDAEHLHRRVKDFIKKQTLFYIQERIKNLPCTNINHISLKDTVSRWGSCSSGRNLSFCWRLSLAPLFVLDYVIIHEVAHLKHMNHSIDFWLYVKELGGQTHKAKTWLKQNALYLHSFL
ncbi:MAG: M48 family metallopeptidase [Alphaproteobacteria bacterium]|nr:M48 family metallopeptidase [Alphaproteobacteria bacterium]